MLALEEEEGVEEEADEVEVDVTLVLPSLPSLLSLRRRERAPGANRRLVPEAAVRVSPLVLLTLEVLLVPLLVVVAAEKELAAQAVRDKVN